MANKGIKIALAGQDTKYAATRDLVFDSTLNTFKYRAVVQGSIVVNNSPNSTTSGANFTITHNFGYCPSFIVYMFDNATGTMAFANGSAGLINMYTDKKVFAALVGNGDYKLIVFLGADDLDDTSS